MIERILLASDGPGAWTAAAVVTDLVAASQDPLEVEMLHVNEMGHSASRDRCASTGSFPERRRQAAITHAACPVMVVREPGLRL